MIDGIVMVAATPVHFEAIVAIERARGGGSVVAMTHGHALSEAIERGHIVAVGLSGGDVAGWIWCSVDDSRGGESVGQLHCVGVVRDRGDVAATGLALVEHVRTLLAERGCTHMRTTLAGDDAETATLLTSAGFAVDAVIMRRAL